MRPLARRALALVSAMIPLHSAAETAPPALGPWAVFMSAGRTEAVRAGDASRWIATGRVRVLPDGRLERFATRLESNRPSARGGPLVANASRRADLLVARTGTRVWAPAFSPPPPWPAAPGWRSDELTLLQLTPDHAQAVWFRQGTALGRSTGRAIEPEALAGGPTFDPAAGLSAVGWLARTVPGFSGFSAPCVDQALGTVALEAPGGRRGQWLLLDGSSPECTGRLRLLPLGAGTPSLEAWGEADRRPGPGVALTLAPRPLDARWAIEDAERLLALGEPCVGRALSLEREGEPPTALGETQSLSGLRWFDTMDHPWARWWPWVFRRADAPCGRGPVRAEVPGAELDGGVEDWPAEAIAPRGRLCALQEAGGRAWAGPDDLSGAVSVAAAGARVRIALRVHEDTPPSPNDRVRLRLGRATIEVTASGDLRTIDGDVPGDVRVVVARRADGYSAEVDAPAGLLGPDLALAALLVDVDAGDPPGHALGLWLAGEPDTAGDARPLPAMPWGDDE